MNATNPISNSPARRLSLRDVRISLPSGALFPALNVEITAGEIVTLMGPSGCGKSSVLALIAGTLDPVFSAEGDVLIDSKSVLALPAESRRVGIQFQDDLLFPHLSVAQNLLFALPQTKRDGTSTGNSKQRRASVDAALERAGLAGFGDRDPATLSGGQRARIALTRTLLADPAVLLLDEPFNKLDANLRAEFRAYVFALARENGLPTLLVTHDAADAEAAGGRVIELNA
jgi:putative thiamine transport system ATP-binding protein